VFALLLSYHSTVLQDNLYKFENMLKMKE